MNPEIDYSKVKHYLAVIRGPGGIGSWSHDPVAGNAIQDVMKRASDDWGAQEGFVDVYDLTDADIFTTGPDPKNSETGAPLPYLYSMSFKMTPPPKRRR